MLEWILFENENISLILFTYYLRNVVTYDIPISLSYDWD